MKKYSKVILLTMLVVILSGSIGFCTDDSYFPAGEWRRSTPEAQGIDSNRIYQMIKTIQSKEINIHSVLIIRNGYLVTEAYFDPFSKDIKQELFSCTKSFVSALTGIAIQDGYLKDVDQKVLDVLEYRGNVEPAVKKEISIKHVLTMSSGLELIPTFQMLQSKNPVQSILQRPMPDFPGQVFRYNGGAAHLMTAMLTKATGSEMFSYAKAKLFQPLGITDVAWVADPNGINVGGTGLRLAPPDLAKFGYLYLRNGVWKGVQVVPQEWVEVSTQKQIESNNMPYASEKSGYGYLWWINSFGGYAAHGFAGQYIIVVPKLDLVVVFTGGLSDQNFATPHQLADQFLLPAVKSNQPISVKANEQKKLAALIAEIGTQKARPIGSLPKIANEINNKVYTCEKNSFNISKFKLEFLNSNEAELQIRFYYMPEKTFCVPVGLDNVYRGSINDELGELYVKGNWVNTNTYQLAIVRQSDRFKLKLVFENDQLHIKVIESGEEFDARQEK